MKKEFIFVSKAKVKKVHRLDREKLKAFINDPVRNQQIDRYRLETDPEKKRLLKWFFFNLVEKYMFHCQFVF